jgi:hypothetical protein
VSCEDFPCCGHERGCCPSFDVNGKQLDMKCTCGASVPLTSNSSMCKGCLGRMFREEYQDDCYPEELEDSDYPYGVEEY